MSIVTDAAGDINTGLQRPIHEVYRAAYDTCDSLMMSISISWSMIARFEIEILNSFQFRSAERVRFENQNRRNRLRIEDSLSWVLLA